MNNQGKTYVSKGPYTFPVESIDVRVIKEIYDLYERNASRPEYIADISDQSWRKIINNEVLNLYSKKGLGFYYSIMVSTNYDLLSSGEDFGVDDITPVVAPAFEVRERASASSHRVGELIGVTYEEIKNSFGEPTYESPYDDKVTTEWSIMFEGMGHSFIYDFKKYDTDPRDITEWSIGGRDGEQADAVLLTLYRNEGGDSSFQYVGRLGVMEEQVDTELKYAIDQQYRNEPEKRKEILDSLEDDHIDGYYVGAYKELSFDVDPRELVNKLVQEKGYGRVVDEVLGGNGTAYFTSKGNVIKLTGDKSEYETANVIKGKNNKYIADVYESGRLQSSHINGGEGYIIIMEELGLPKQMSDTFDNCCCGVNKPIYVEYNETPAVIHPPVDGDEECNKLHKNLLMIRQELTQYGIGWSDIGIDNLGMKNGKLALLDLGETTGGKDTGQTIELNESGADDFWEDNEGRITLQDILELTKDIKIVQYPTILLANLALTWDDNPEEIERISQVEVSTQYPILIMVHESGEINWILDGNHRAQKALGSKSKTIPAKLIKPSDLNDEARRILLRLDENKIIKEEKLNSDLGEDYIQEIVDRIYPNIVNKLGPSKYFDKPPTVELWKDIYARVSGIEGMEGEHSASSKAQFDEDVNIIYVYYPNMEDVEDVIKSLLHEYTHYLQDPDEREENRKDGYDLDPDEIASAKAELKWKDYLVYLEDRLNEDIEGEQMELDLPTPIGEFEFPVGYEDYTVDGKLYDGDEQESVDVIKDAVSNEAVTYLFKKWDKSGISFEDLKLLGIPTNNSLTRTMLVKRYLKNTYKNIPVYHEFDCDDLADMFIKNPRDYSTDYIQKYLCADDSWMDYDGWYDTDWYDGMEDGLDEQNWETIVKILKVPNKEIADNLINDRPQNEEEERMVNELEEEISEIKNSIVWGHNDESEYATKNDMAEDITDKLAVHFEGDGKLIQDDNGMFSWRIEGNLLDYLEDDMWDNTEVFQHHPDYAGATLEEWLQDLTHELPESIFQALMLEEFTFLDYDYGKRGDMLEPETKWFDGYYHPDYDINQAVFDRLREVEYEFSSNSPEQLDEETDIFGQGLMDPINPEDFEGTEEEWEELVSSGESWEEKPNYEYTDGKTDPEKGFVAPSKEVTDNICNVENFCKEQGPITFGQLKALVEAATSKRIAGDMGRGVFKTLWRIIPFFIPQVLLAAVGVTATRAINKIVTPALKDTKGYKSWWGKVVLKAMDIAEGDYIPDVALGDDPLGKVFFISDGLLEMIKDKYKLKFARYVADVAASRPDSEPVPDWFVENLLRDYLNQKFLLDPPLQPKKGLEFEDLKSPITEIVQKKSEPFSKKESLMLKHISKNFTKSQLQNFTELTPHDWGNEGKEWAQLMKMFGISVNNQEKMATSTQLAKYALDNWTEDGDYSKIEDPIRDEIGWWDVNYSETGSQIEYKDGNVEVLAFSDDDAEHRAGNEFWDWEPEQPEISDYGDYEAYDSEASDPKFMNMFPGHPWLKESVDRHDKPYEFFTNIWDKHGPTLEPAVLKLYGVSDWSIDMLRRFLMDYLGGREQVENDISEILPKVSNLVVCGGYEFGIFDTKVQVDKDGTILLEVIIDGDGHVTLLETDWEGKSITLKLADVASEEHWGMTKHPFRNPNYRDGDPREWDDGDYYDWEHIWGDIDYEIVDCINEHFSKEIGKRFSWLEFSTEYALDPYMLSEGVEGDQEWHTKEQGDFFTLDGSENLGSTDIFKDDGFDIVHQYRGDVHLSDISPEESETAIPQGSKKVKKTVLKPRLDKGPFNIPIKMNEHQGYGNVEDNPDLNPEVEEGDVIELLYMDDPYSIPIKTKGVVMGFEGKPGDFAFKILVNWIMGPDKLSPMALLPEADIYRFPKKQDNLNEQWEKPYNDPKAVVNGKEIQLDVADTEFLKQKGMMYKTSYPKNRGMLFLWDDIVPISMWMRNTLLPLDIIYMVDGEVVDYDKDVQPCEEQQCDTYGDVNANQVMELLSGGVDNYGISVGDKIELVDI